MDVFGFAIDAAGDFLKAAAIDAGFELGVFSAVAVEPCTLDQLAAMSAPHQTSARRLRALLDVLVAIGALVRVGDRYAAGTIPARPIVERAGWGLMSDAIRRDRALNVEGGEVEQRYHLHLLEVGKEPARELAAMLPGGSLVDLGGGAGTYTRAYLDAHPDAHATIVDFSDVLVLARAVLAEPYRDRVTFEDSEISMLETAGDHAVALLSNVVHLHAPAFCERYVAAAARHVRPGGLVVIKDLRVDEDRSGPLASLLFALNMAIYTGGGDVYPTSQLRTWLEAAGLVAIEERRLASSPDSIVLIAKKPTRMDAVPRPLRETLARARTIAPELAPALDAHYLELMPRMRDAQHHLLLDTALEWAKLPRLASALDRLFAVLHACEVPGVLGHVTAAELRAATPTIAALHARTHYGGCMPLLYGYPADLAYFSSRGLDTHAAIDRYLTSPILHELCHFAPERDALPTHLDECIAGWLAVHVWPEFAYPAAGQDDAIYAAPWLSQIGQAFARVFGIATIVRAQAGVTSWRDALSPGVLERITTACHDDWARRRTLHFLSDTLDPDPWVALALETPPPADPAFDRVVVADALRAMCLANAQVESSFRTRTVVPEAIELDGAHVTTAISGDLDYVAPRYWLPPAVAATIRARGHTGYTLFLGTTEAIPAAVATICDGEEPRNFVLVPR